MSTSIVHVLTFIGRSAKSVEAACEELLSRRSTTNRSNRRTTTQGNYCVDLLGKVDRQPNVYGSDDWSAVDHKDIADFCVTLINAARDLPVLYYAQYLDGWSVGNSMLWLLEWPDGRRCQICGSEYGLSFYPSEHGPDLLAQIKKKRRMKFYRTQSEDRWYLNQVQEAIDYALGLQADFLVVSISQCLGPSRLDEEVKAALETQIGLPPNSQ